MEKNMLGKIWKLEVLNLNMNTILMILDLRNYKTVRK
jgi:hypothetical protein